MEKTLKQTPHFFVLCGPSGCGKSTLAKKIRETLGPGRCGVLSTDNYYQDLSRLTQEERNGRNFDCLEAIDTVRMVEDLSKLKSGKTVAVPRYDFATHSRLPGGDDFAPRETILIEGIFAAALLAKTGIPDAVVYLDLPSRICLERRVIRDQAERGRTREEIEARFHKDILPANKALVLPQKAVADLVLDATRPVEELLRCTMDFVEERSKTSARSS